MENAETDLEEFVGPKLITTIWTLHLKCSRETSTEFFRLVQKLTMGEADLNQFMRLTNHVVIAAENFGREENLSPFLIPTLSKDMDEQLKLAHKVVNLVDGANRKFCVNLLRYSVYKPESSHAQVRLIARKKENENFQQIVYVNYKLEEFIHLLDGMNSENCKVFANKHF